MMLNFVTKRCTSNEIGAAIHPRDKLARAQFVQRDVNPSYWTLIKTFEQKTGTVCVLNTSFNLHGYPLVNTPEAALSAFLNSRLDYPAIGNCLIAKPSEISDN